MILEDNLRPLRQAFGGADVDVQGYAAHVLVSLFCEWLLFLLHYNSRRTIRGGWGYVANTNKTVASKWENQKDGYYPETHGAPVLSISLATDQKIVLEASQCESWCYEESAEPAEWGLVFLCQPNNRELSL